MRTYDPVYEGDEPVECSIPLCTMTATFDDYFDEPLCPDHLEEAYEEARADAQVDGWYKEATGKWVKR